MATECSISSTDCHVVLLETVYFILDDGDLLQPSPTLWVGTMSGVLCVFNVIFREGAAICSERLELDSTSEQTDRQTDDNVTNRQKDRQTDRQTVWVTLVQSWLYHILSWLIRIIH